MRIDENTTVTELDHLLRGLGARVIASPLPGGRGVAVRLFGEVGGVRLDASCTRASMTAAIDAALREYEEQLRQALLRGGPTEPVPTSAPRAVQ